MIEILLFMLFVPWFLYPAFLYVFAKLCPLEKKDKNVEHQHCISVIIACHNEEKNVVKRIENIFSLQYPNGLVEVIIASDGSTDNTVNFSRKMSKAHNIQTVESKSQVGRAGIQNLAVKQASNEILIFSDADTVFKEDFFNKISEVFSDDKVGYVNGKLVYLNKNETSITKDSSLYWRFEMFLRKIETQLGVYLFGTGACSAVRRDLFIDLDPIDDIDFTTPLDVVKQGFKCIHLEGAVAYDIYPDTPKKEFSARVRMTSKNLIGTIRRWGVDGVVKHPVYSLVLLAHKILRWFFPFIFLMHLSLSLILSELIPLSVVVNILGVVFLLLALFYELSSQRHSKLSYFYNFTMVNIAFMIGVWKVIIGNVQSYYKPINKVK